VKRSLVAASTVAGAAAFAYSLSTLGLGHIREGLVRIGWGFGAILVLSGLREVARAIAWTRTLDSPNRLPLGDALRARLAGEALNTLLPMGFLIGEPAKAQRVADRLPFATAFAALMIEFAFYTASLPLLFGCAALLVLPPVASLGIVVLGAAVVPALKRVTHAVEPLRRFALAQPRRAGTIFALEASYHALGILETYVVLLCVSAGAAWTSALLLETMNRGVTIVFKMLPLRLGVDEAAAALVTNRLSLGSTTGVMLALVRKLRMLFWAALGLACMLVRTGEQGERAHAIAAEPPAQNLQRTAEFRLV
jgi:lysylphosphatidylglycerol synthase-like protein